MELLDACRAGNLQRVQELHGQGVSLAAADNDGWQPIHFAAARDLDVVKWLHGQGVPLTAATNIGWQPILAAAARGHLDLAQWLHGQGVPLTAATNSGWQPIHAAAADGHLDVVKWLHGQGVPLTAATNNGSQPIHCAARFGHLDVVKWLHGQGADAAVTVTGGQFAGDTPAASARSNGHDDVANWLDGVLNAPPRQPPRNAPQPPPAPTRVDFGTVVGSRAKASIAVPDFALGTLLIGDPGSGKTWLLKQLIASCAVQLTSLKEIIVLDLKGDLTQMIRGTDVAFDQDVDVCVYTVGSDMGLPGTLELNSFDLTTREGKRGFVNLATDVAADVLSGTVCLDKTGNARLEGGFDMPTARNASGAYGVRAADDKKIASALIDSVCKVFFKCKEAGGSVPTSFEQLLRELNQADQPYVGATDNRRDARPIVMGPVSQEDLDAVKREIEVRMDPSGGLELLYQPIKGNEAAPSDDDVYPLDASTFCGPREAGKRVKLSIVNLALLGNGYGAETMRKLVASTVLRRIEGHASEGTGTQAAPETMVVVDEAHMVMPNVGQTQSGDAVTSTAMAKRLLQLHRDKGFPLVIATQRPADLDKNLRGMITGTRLIGKLEGTDKDRKDLIDTVVKNTDHNKSFRDKMKTLQPRQFIHIASGGSDAPQVVESGQLKRLHESSAAWVKGFSPQHPLAAHDEERRAKRARSGAAGSSGR